MHEVRMMQGVLDRAIVRAKDGRAQHIRLVQMRVGEASGVMPDSLEVAFDVAKKGTIAEDAKLQVEHVPLVCYCSNCNSEFHPINELCECPECYQPYCEIRQGKEFEIAFLEVS
ncbi:hydrogenase nickel insertion protein HypA [Nostoc minutum NIES-26]|uniref:Hydrogenase maturation factor HypA n=1 Tax=Nostoc minutum NIES-26 TaxID=1844469 RepID=A0A367S1T6_9NOSO|nr:hydrogenase nickel insertion protein HypA [Nostoc minutum NIES-26]